MKSIISILAFVCALAAGDAAAQIAAPVIEANLVAQDIVQQPAPRRIPAGAAIAVELAEPLSSRTSKQEQTFALRLAQPIMIGNEVVVAAGAVGGGEVIDAAPSAFGGRQGRLILSARFIEIGGQRVRIRGLQFSAAGKDRSGAVMATSFIPYAGVASIFIHGGEVVIPEGTQGVALLATDVDLPPLPTATPTPAPTAEIIATTGKETP